MEAFAGGVAVIQAAEIAIKVGEQLIAKYKAFKHANKRLSDLVLRVEGVWVKTTMQMTIIRDLAGKLNSRLETFQEECFRRLTNQMQAADLKIEDIAGPKYTKGIDLANLTIDAGFSKRLRYSLVERHIEQTVKDLEAWHTIFDPSWLLIARLNHSSIDSVLMESTEINKHSDTLTVVRQVRALVYHSKTVQQGGSIFRISAECAADSTMLSPTSLRSSRLASTDEEVLLDTTIYPPDSDDKQVERFVRNLARLLSSSAISKLNLLRCLGVIPLHISPSSPQYQFIFALPTGSSRPLSLREILSRPSISLDAKVSLARSLARALTSLHAADFVHKNIRPETIVVFEDENKEYSKPYIVGFESIRPIGGHSALRSDMVFHKNLYRHPSRQGLQVQESYNMRHDIYSLGVCLLEIGRWTSFIQYDVSDSNKQPTTSLPIQDLSEMKNKIKAAHQIKSVLLQSARDDLPSRMGRVYTEIVVSSLTCLDKDAAMIGEDNLIDQDGIEIGVAFIENILMRLEAITL